VQQVPRSGNQWLVAEKGSTANSGIVIELQLEDFKPKIGALAGMEFQKIDEKHGIWLESQKCQHSV
jgi:hypothetical protein